MKKLRCKTVLLSLMMVIIGLSCGCSTFQLTSTPNADIYEKDKRIGSTPFEFDMMPGHRTFVLKHYGYVEEELTVASLDRKQIHVVMEFIGKTRIDSEPPGAQVVRIEDGEILGTTPCALYLPRPDRVVLQLRGHERFEQDLTPNHMYMVELEPTPGFQEASFREIDFVSDQGEVKIYDRAAGVQIGSTPVSLRVRAGTALEYRLEGYEPAFNIVSRNAPRRIVIQMQALTTVTLEGPEGAEVYRAGGLEKIGTLPFRVQTRGNALFDIKKEGYYDHSVAVAPDTPSTLTIELKKIPYKTIETNPPGADVYRLGGLEKLGTAPFKTIVEDERVFEIKKKGYRSTMIGMGPTSSSTLSVPLTPLLADDPNAAAIGTLSDDTVESF